MFVPTPLSLSGSLLLLVDYPDDFEATAKVGSDGTASITTDPVPLGYYWRAERYTTVVSTIAGGAPILAPPAATLSVYKTSDGSSRPIRYRDGSSAPGLDVADNSQPVIIQGGLSLLFLWAGLTPNTYASISLQYSLLRRVDGSA